MSSRVGSGHYANAGEVMRTALRLLERGERDYEEKLAALRGAIAEGDASGDAEEGVFERLYAYIDELAAGKKGTLRKYSVSKPAQSDMRAIAIYTVEKWGAAQAIIFAKGMDRLRKKALI